jgi:NitT/TauT family transport system permease protein
MKANKIGEGFLILLFWIGLWWMLSLMYDRFVIPSPLDTLIVLVELLKTAGTYVFIGLSMFRVLMSLLIGIGLGVFFGMLAGYSKIVKKILQPFILMVKSTPVVSLIIILNIYVDTPLVPIVCGILLCFPIMYSNINQGYNMVDSKLIHMSSVYKVPLKRRIIKLYLPSTLPYFFAGILTSIGICWKATIAAEVLAFLPKSIGYQIYSSKIMLEFDHVFAWSVIIVICSLLIELLTKQLIKKLNFYERFKVI